MTAPSSSTTTNDSSDMPPLPIRMISTVVRGFGRGSADLGIPTANLDLAQVTVDLPCGIYWGFARIGDEPTYTAALSIGYNPTYGNGG